LTSPAKQNSFNNNFMHNTQSKNSTTIKNGIRKN
jgi:hypothetical protein